MNKNRIFAIIFAIITVSITVFIFANSLKNGEDSAKQSGFFTNIVERALNTLGLYPERDMISLFVRKLAHFSEYFALSAFAATALAFGLENKKTIIIAPIYSFCVSVCDEFIVQAITEGRGPSWTDVLIDSSGAVLAFTILALIIAFRKGRNI